MKVIIQEDKNRSMFRFFDWIIYIVGYALVLISISVIFPKTFYIDSEYYGLWALIASIIIYILNRTIKPILVWMTLPLTALTLGLFYPIINVIVLNITDIILGNHFKIQGFLMSIIVAISISLMRILLNKLIIEKIIGGKK